jgi:hypothetical protein
MREHLMLKYDTAQRKWYVLDSGVFRFVSITQMRKGDDNNFILTVGHADQEAKG